MYAVAKLDGDSAQGIARFHQPTPSSPTEVTVSIKGISPGQHGLHVHTYGDTERGCASMGAHFDYGNVHDHGARHSINRHTGDLGNVTADQWGVVAERFSDDRIALSGPRSILGRGLVLHAQPDDLGRGGDAESKITGNAGARIACGIIALSDPNKALGN